MKFLKKKLINNQGQSVIEFLLSLPLLVGLTLLMIRFNTPIQASIVNQRYVRSQALFLAMNSPYYPEASKRSSEQKPGYISNRTTIGMTRDTIEEINEDNVEPKSPFFAVTLTGKKAKEGKLQETEKKRTNVRVWTSVSMCTNNWFREMNQVPDNFLTSLPSGFTPDNVVSAWCGSPLDSYPNPDSRFDEDF